MDVGSVLFQHYDILWIFKFGTSKLRVRASHGEFKHPMESSSIPVYVGLLEINMFRDQTSTDGCLALHDDVFISLGISYNLQNLGI